MPSREKMKGHHLLELLNASGHDRNSSRLMRLEISDTPFPLTGSWFSSGPHTFELLVYFYL